MSPDSDWTLEVRVRLGREVEAEWLYRALVPESAREVPRARTEVDRPQGDTVRVRVTARDTGVVRAATNTYLGWVHLTLETLGAARRTPSS